MGSNFTPNLDDRLYRTILEIANDHDNANRGYEKALTTAAMYMDPSKVAGLEQQLVMTTEAVKIRYTLFYLLHIYYRRTQNFAALQSLMDRFTEDFTSQPSFPHLVSLYYRQANTFDAMQKALEEARMASHQCPTHAGILNNLAEIVAALGENDHDVTSDVAEEAMASIQHAIALDRSYPKFYGTKGRLLALKGEYESARSLIQQAINMEDSEEFDYAVRLGDYQAHLLGILMLKFKHDLRQDLDQAQRDIQQHRQSVKESLNQQQASVESTVKSAQSSNLQFLGFFTALLSFVLGSTQILSHESTVTAEHLIIVLGGVMLLVVLTFTTVLQNVGQRWPKSYWMGLVVAVVLIIGGFLY